MAAPTYHGSNANPTDNGAANEPSNQAVSSGSAPLSTAVAGDLLVMIGSIQVVSTGQITMFNTGGQTWFGPFETSGNDTAVAIWWAQFNGTWIGNPGLTFAAQSGTQPTTMVFHIFRPSTVGTWRVDQDFSGTAQATADPIGSISLTPTKRDNVTLAGLAVTGAPTLSSLSGTGWAVTGTNQYRNTAGSDITNFFAHRLQATPDGSADASWDLSGSASGSKWAMVWYNDLAPTIALNTGGLLVDTYNESNQNGGDALYNGGSTAAGQAFTATAGGLLKATFYLWKSGSPTGNIVSKLYAHSGTFGTNGVPTGSALATSSAVNIATLTGSAQLIDFNFDGSFTLVNTTKYFIVVEYSGGDASNHLGVGLDSSSASHAGNYAQFSPSTWTPRGDLDAVFYVYSTAASFSDTTPTLEFTGTDGNADDVRYNTQIDTVNTFDSTPNVGDPVVDDSHSHAFLPINFTSTRTGTGQSFQSGGGKLHSVRFPLERTGNPTGNAVAKVYAHSGTFGTSSIPTGAALATSDNVAVGTIPTTAAEMEFTFSGAQQITLTASTHYVVAVEYGSSDASNFIKASYRGSQSHAGNASKLDSGTWSAGNAGEDVAFAVYLFGPGPQLDKFSGTDAGFLNTVSGGDTDPFNSGEKVSFTLQAGDELAGGEYFWRARALDPNGGNTWSAWATARSFTVTTGPEVEADGSSAGVGTVAAIGAAIFVGVGEANGAGAATGVGTGIAVGAGSADGSATTSGVGGFLSQGTGAATGEAEVLGESSFMSGTIAAAAGIADAAAVGASFAIVLGESAGVGTATGVGVWFGTTLAESAGSGTASGIAAALSQSDAVAAGTATTVGVGGFLSQGTGSSIGTADALAQSLALSGGVASSTGESTTAGIGVSVATALGTSDGVGAALAESQTSAPVEADASSSGIGDATAISAAFSLSVAESSGIGEASGTAAGLTQVVGASDGTASATATGAALWVGVGSTSGVADAIAIVAALALATAASDGVSSALGESDSSGFAEADASSDGLSDATAVGASFVLTVGSTAGVGEALGLSVAVVPTIGDSAGVGAASGTAAWLVAAIASAAGSGSALAEPVGADFVEADGVSAGTSTATADSSAVFATQGESDGVGVSTGIAAAFTVSTAAAEGVGAGAGVGAVLIVGVGAAAGAGETTGVTVILLPGTGAASGTAEAASESAHYFASLFISSGGGTAAADSLAFWESVGSSDGLATVLGVGEAAAVHTFSGFVRWETFVPPFGTSITVPRTFEDSSLPAFGTGIEVER